MAIRVRANYKLIVGNKIQKTADQMNVEAIRGNLFLVSNKQITGRGNK